MNVFVTGATGYIGSAVVAELIGAGHTVTGLARNGASARALGSAGAAVHRGDLDDLDALRAAASAAEGVLHLAFVHDFSRYAEAGEIDRKAVEAMAGAVRPGGALFVTSGTAVMPRGAVATEDAPADAKAAGGVRLAGERAALDAARRGLRAGVVRLPPSVCGDRDPQFVAMLIGLARNGGFAAYVGEGANLWPSVNRLDAARAFRLALERAPAGTIAHAVGDEGAPFRAIAEAIAAGLGLPARSIAAAEADAHFGWISKFAQLDNPTSSAATRKLLGWAPSHPTLMSLLRDGDYFAGK